MFHWHMEVGRDINTLTHCMRYSGLAQRSGHNKHVNLVESLWYQSHCWIPPQ